MALHVCLNGYSHDVSNLVKLRELTELLGDTADHLGECVLNGNDNSGPDNG